MKCVADIQCSATPHLDRNLVIALDFSYGTYHHNCLLYNPIYDNKEQLEKRSEIMSPKKHIQEILSVEEYESEKQNFEFNKILFYLI